jgi:hypothetical protein
MVLNLQQKILMAIVTLIYLTFLLGDIGKIFNTNNLKFISIILCFLITFTYKEYISKKDVLFLRIAKFFTIITDYLLLFTNNFFYGVCLFCVIQIIYIYRHGGIKSKGKIDLLLKYLLIFIMGIFSLNYFGFFKKESSFIIVSIYCCLIIYGTIVAFFGRGYNKKLYINRKLIFYGMFLFLLCDINVGLSNLLDFTIKNKILNSIKIYSRDLIWLFYLPSQLMLSLSGEKLHR